MTEIQTAALLMHGIDRLGGGTTPRRILENAIDLLTESVNLDLDIDDMTGQQQRDTAEALNVIAGMLRAYAGDFRKAAKHNTY